MMKNNKKKIFILAAIGAVIFTIKKIYEKKKKSSVYIDDKHEVNPLEGKKVIFVEDDEYNENADGKRGYLQSVGEMEYEPGIYEKYVKRFFDFMASSIALILLSPVLLIISLAIVLDDPGPVLFTQKRVGKNKKYFKLHKFRSMKMCTPHDVPTHMLENPEQYITRVGKFLREHSLDELPQIWDIFLGNMSIVGPRPALWNQDVLTAERDRYGANNITPGLTGWAQINGRDEISLELKAKLDGEYVEKIGPIMDAKCFIGSLGIIAHDSSIVEGGTGQLEKDGRVISIAEWKEQLDIEKKVKILVAGKGSYIGESFREYMDKFDNYEIDSFDTISESLDELDFTGYDVIYDVAGIAHIKETKENEHLYYDVNRDMAFKIAEKAQNEGVKHFIYLSSMSVYGISKGIITEHTPLKPINAYGKSKMEAEQLLSGLIDENFTVSIIRPPMVYGKGCKGNYQTLRKFALKAKIFPDYKNQRSMLYIDNLSSAVRGIIHNKQSGIYFPQNTEYMATYHMMKEIASCRGKSLMGVTLFNPIISVFASHISIFEKVFGTLIYDQSMNVPEKWIEIKDNGVSIRLTEEANVSDEKDDDSASKELKAKIIHILKHNAAAQLVYRYTMSACFRFIGFFIKTDEHLVLMNGHGSRFNDSPRAIYQKMVELGLLDKYHVVWALNDPDKYDIPGCEKIKMDTLKYFITALKAKYWISCVNIERALHFKKKNTIYLNTWHGALINLCGNAVAGRNDFHWDYIDYFCVCGDYEKPFITRDFGVKQESLIMTGYPRNDELYESDEATRQYYRDKFDVPANKKIILYAPTWRETNDGGSSYQLAPPIDWRKWEEELGDQYVVLLRTHPYTTKLMNVQFNDFVKDYTEYPEVNHLLIAADILISDYSSINLDYCILGKPMICFGYDYEQYTKDRGFYYDLEETMPSGVVKTEEDLIRYILNMDEELEKEKTCKFRDDHMQYGGNASVACINKLFHTNF